MFAAPRRDLREYLARVPDPRGRQGKRHVFSATLTAVVCAMLQGCRGYEAIAQWLAEQPLDFLWTLGFTRRPPTETGVRRLLSRLDVTAFEAALNLYLAEHLGWSSVRQVFRITRDVAQIDRLTGEKKQSLEVVYGITSPGGY